MPRLGDGAPAGGDVGPGSQRDARCGTDARCIHDPITPALRARELHALGLVVAAGCQPAKVVIDYDSGAHTPDDTGGSGDGESGGATGTIPDGGFDCGEVPHVTIEMLASGDVESALLCQAAPDDSECPSLESNQATPVRYESFHVASTGACHDAWASCGPVDRPLAAPCPR